MKEPYNELEMEVIEFEVEDVIRTSIPDPNEGEPMPLGMGF